MKNVREVELDRPIKHIAFIMDGNGRWANERGLPRTAGHKVACERLPEILDYCIEYDIRVMSFYAFSTENWRRPRREIMMLFNYLEVFFKKQLKRLLKDRIQVRISGDISMLPEKTQATCKKAIEATKDCENYVFNICLNYGGRPEIVRAAKLLHEDLVAGKITEEEVNEKVFENYLYTHDLPNVDLMVRTSGERRLSNYLIWQNAYAEFVFTPVKWPDFDKDAFLDCLEEFNHRDRRFGGIKPCAINLR